MNVNDVVDKYLTERPLSTRAKEKFNKEYEEKFKPSWEIVAKVIKTINSCKNEKQLKVAQKMMDRALKMKKQVKKIKGFDLEHNEYELKERNLKNTIDKKKIELGIK